MSGPLLRDENDDCRRKDGKKAGQSRRSRKDRRDKTLSIRVTDAVEDKLWEQLHKGGYSCQADLLDALFAAYLFVTRQGPMPDFARLDDKA